MKRAIKAFAWALSICCVSAGPTTRPPAAPPSADGQKTAADADIAQYIGRLSGSDGLAREVAIRRLLPCSRAAAPRVVEPFVRTNLAGRLSALELLSAWNAPVQGLDPWQP